MNWKHLIKVLGDAFSYAIVLNFYIWLVVAMFSGGVVNVLFNHYNEALLEYIVYIIIFPIITYSVIVDMREYRRRKHGKRSKLSKSTSRDSRA